LELAHLGVRERVGVFPADIIAKITERMLSETYETSVI
jgi:hypothetical protein